MSLTRHIPCRTSYAFTTMLVAAPWATWWERIYRQVFWLADGSRDTQRIALLLHKPEDLVIRVAQELTVSGYLSLQTNKKVVQMNPAVLKRSFELLAPQKEAFAHRFYLRLCDDYPQTRPLFARTDMKRLEGAFMATLAMVIAGVERGDNLAPFLEKAGAKHQRFGAQAEHYPLFAAALLATFHEVLGSAFTPAMEDSWAQAYELISTRMLQVEEPDIPIEDETTAKLEAIRGHPGR